MPLHPQNAGNNPAHTNEADQDRPLFIDFDLYTDGDDDYKKELGALLIENVRELQRALNDSVQDGDTVLFHETCHKVKVTLSMLEDQELNQMVEALRQDISALHQSADLVRRTARFHTVCDQIIHSLKKQIRHEDTCL